MPEGHTVARWASELRPLRGEPLREVRSAARWRERAERLVGRHVTRVDTHGKNLLIRVSNGTTIRCHAMQYGSWQIGEPGMTLRKPERFIRLRLVTDAHDAVFYHGPVVEFLTRKELAAHADLAALGPDVLAPSFDAAEGARRIRATPERAIGDAILDQRNVAGIGNIYKSEGLFLAGIDPRRDAASLSDAELERLWNATTPLMRAGIAHTGATTTLPDDMARPGLYHWVYRRRGHACLRCGTKVQMVRQGELGRATYFCPTCQT